MLEPLKLADFPPVVRALYLKAAKEYAMLGGETRSEPDRAVQEMPVCLIEALRIVRTPTTMTDPLPPHCEDYDEHH